MVEENGARTRIGLGDWAVRISFVKYRATVKGLAGRNGTFLSKHHSLKRAQGAA
jgi:hypothetical protein